MNKYDSIFVSAVLILIGFTALAVIYLSEGNLS